MFKCYAKREGDYWVGICVDFCLATQDDTIEEVKQVLGEMIETYIEDVLDTNDEKSIKYLLNRKAPLWDRIYYYFAPVRWKY